MQDYIDYLTANFKASKHSKKPNMSNTGKSITNVKKGKDRALRGLKTTAQG